mmetsp:Transcript_2066/g.2334  ORF Transcript_2066/g.2334 Transcript_2066/m.2334 type:complete len:197 (-) Transcript_2066:87-677(-)
MAIKKGQAIKKNFKFDDHKFYVTVSSNMQTDEDIDEVKMVDVAYIPPPFKSAEGGAPKKFRRTTVTRKSMRQSIAAAAPAKVAIPEGVGQDEIKEIDVLRSLWSCYYCIKQFKNYQEIINTSIENGKTPDNMIKTKMLLYQSQMEGIQSAIENEQVSLDQYMGFLKKGIDHDKILLKYFEDIGADSKAKAVKYRIQ